MEKGGIHVDLKIIWCVDYRTPWQNKSEKNDWEEKETNKKCEWKEWTPETSLGSCTNYC